MVIFKLEDIIINKVGAWYFSKVISKRDVNHY